MFKKLFKIVCLATVCALVFTGCSTTEPEPIKLNVDNCEHCKMTVADLRFAAEMITDKGRVYKFDDLECLLDYKKEKNISNALFFVADYNKPESFVKSEQAALVSGEAVQSPMNGNVAAFSSKKDAEAFAVEKSAALTTWEEVSK